MHAATKMLQTLNILYLKFRTSSDLKQLPKLDQTGEEPAAACGASQPEICNATSDNYLCKKFLAYKKMTKDDVSSPYYQRILEQKYWMMNRSEYQESFLQKLVPSHYQIHQVNEMT